MPLPMGRQTHNDTLVLQGGLEKSILDVRLSQVLALSGAINELHANGGIAHRRGEGVRAAHVLRNSIP